MTYKPNYRPATVEELRQLKGADPGLVARVLAAHASIEDAREWILHDLNDQLELVKLERRLLAEQSTV